MYGSNLGPDFVFGVKRHFCGITKPQTQKFWTMNFFNDELWTIPLTHSRRVTHIYVGTNNSIGSDNGLSPIRCQAIIWTNDGILLIGPLGTNCIGILNEIHRFSFKKIRLKVSSAKWRPLCLGLNVLTKWPDYAYFQTRHHWVSHYNDAIMVAMASHITGVWGVWSNVWSSADQIKHQSSAPLVFVRGNHRLPVDSPHKGSVTRIMFPFDDVIISTGIIAMSKFKPLKLRNGLPVLAAKVPVEWKINSQNELTNPSKSKLGLVSRQQHHTKHIPLFISNRFRRT